ncbi:iron permease, partial [Bifidobacterium avesanii]
MSRAVMSSIEPGRRMGRVAAKLAAVFALVAAVLAMVATLAMPAAPAYADGESSSSSSSASAADYDTWSDVAKAIDQQLRDGLDTYKSGNTAGSTSAFMSAYNKIYVASNFTAVVRDSLSSDKQSSQQQAFQGIQNLSYVPGNDAKLEEQINALTTDLDDTAKQLDA